SRRPSCDATHSSTPTRGTCASSGRAGIFGSSVIPALAPAKPAPPLLHVLRRAYARLPAPAPAKPAPPLLHVLRRAYARLPAPAPAKPAPPLLHVLRRAYARL